MKKEFKQMWVCLSCGSIHVQQTNAVINLNDNSVDWDATLGAEQYFCQDSEHHLVKLRTIKTVNGAVRVTGYQVRDVAGKIHPAMSNNKSLYSLKQANEMLLDDTPGYWYLKAVYRHDFEGQVKMFEGNPRHNSS
jgi:hypothetical protein